MGADLISVTWTSEGRPDYKRVTERIAELPETTLDYLLATSQTLGYIDAGDYDEVRDVLRDGFTQYELSVLGDHRFTNVHPVSTGALVCTSGGDSWGDDPYEGWSNLCAFLDACEEDDELARAAGFIGWGIQATGEDDVTQLMEALTTALEEEGISPDMIARVLDRVAGLTQN